TIPDQVTVLSKGGKETTTRISSCSILSASGTVSGKDTAMEQFVVMGKDNLSNYPKQAPTKADTYYFAGMGYGHGVGMSQSGAKGMAKEGYSYKEIIKHYYTGVEIIKK
ncbi:MAG: stage II sporulation protein SpoIID, partial [Clostridiales bacterium]|nr:stage II sporulation protein SpoIID [Clostridiales bacterium]